MTTREHRIATISWHRTMRRLICVPFVLLVGVLALILPATLTATSAGATDIANVQSAVTPALIANAPATATVSSSIAGSSLTATLFGALNPSGTISLYVFAGTTAPTTCTSGGTLISTFAVNANQSYPSTVAYTPSTVGNYWWYASYSGDANNSLASSPCSAAMPETVVVAASSVTVPTAAPSPTPTTTPVASTLRPTVVVPSSSSSYPAAGHIDVIVTCSQGTTCTGTVQLSVARKTADGYSHVTLAGASYSLQYGQYVDLAMTTTPNSHAILPRSNGHTHWRATATITTNGAPVTHHPVFVEWKPTK